MPLVCIAHIITKKLCDDIRTEINRDYSRDNITQKERERKEKKGEGGIEGGRKSILDPIHKLKVNLALSSDSFQNINFSLNL